MRNKITNKQTFKEIDENNVKATEIKIKKYKFLDRR